MIFTNALDAHKALVKKLEDEFRVYEKWILTLDPYDILEHSNMYNTKKDIIFAIRSIEVERLESVSQNAFKDIVYGLLNKNDILTRICRDYLNRPTTKLDNILFSAYKISQEKD